MPSGADDESESSEKKCKLCTDKIDRRYLKSAVKCNSPKCSVLMHQKCFDLVTKIFFVEKKDWRCRSCIEDLKVSGFCSGSCTNADISLLQKENECLSREKDLLNKLLDDLEYTVQLQKTQISSLETKTVNSINSLSSADNLRPTSYSEAVKIKNLTSNAPVLLIKATDKSISNIQVEKDVKSKINPGALNININNTKLIRDGLLISCENSHSLNVLKENLNKYVGNVYKVTEPKKFNPRIKLNGVQAESLENGDFLEEIISNNNLNASVADIKIVTKLKYKSLFNVIIEVTPSLFSIIMQKGYLYVGWSKCMVMEHINMSRCFKCCKYGHQERDCRNPELVCPKCSGPHKLKDCTSNTECCINCKNFNSKFKSNFSIQHSVSNPSCEYYKFKVAQLKCNINYEL